MKGYTKSGDTGETSLVYGTRVSKATLYVEAREHDKRQIP